MTDIALKCPSTEVAVVDIFKAISWQELFFSYDVKKYVYEADIVFVSVDTLTKTRGLRAGKVVDLTYWESATRVIADVS
ncbi:UDP-glucose 6-dehydrogenase [Medicago truncatula]|uniref:UDP-glucose 6-dehydrogenase n=1 Tax=Medicago truncatula TaxID=3880 RepID=G7KMC9_MEDTR|nr:UDP-glucose 6-dehydrogenase [Medicago truncatula]